MSSFLQHGLLTIRSKCKNLRTLLQKKVKQWRSTKNNCLPLHVTWPNPIPRPQRFVRKTFSTYFVPLSQRKITLNMWAQSQNISVCNFSQPNSSCAVTMGYNSLYVSLLFSAKQQHEMAKFCIVRRTWITTANFLKFYFKVIAKFQI